MPPCCPVLVYHFKNKIAVTLSAPCGGTSPKVGGIAKSMLYDMAKSER